MYCYQCEESIKGGCKVKGICGKEEDVADLQDILVYYLKGLSHFDIKAKEKNIEISDESQFIIDNLFATITNANFDPDSFKSRIKLASEKIEEIKNKIKTSNKTETKREKELVFEDSTWFSDKDGDIYQKYEGVGVLSTKDEDIRSLRELLIYGLKGIAAYAHHAYVLGKEDEEVNGFIKKALAATLDETVKTEELVNLVLECGTVGTKVMALLDRANTSSFGEPEPTEISIGVRKNPGILISGHDLKDIEEILIQTKGKGIDVYTHSEMLPANCYPEFKKYSHLAGNYGGSWWKQGEEFEKFNGPILMTTNCIIPPKESYKNRIYTTGTAGFSGVKHIPDRAEGKQKDFSEIINHAKSCKAPDKLEEGKIISGFAHSSALKHAGKIVELVKAGKIKRFFVMAGCDGRKKDRDYYTQFANKLPKDTVILTSGCAKYRYNKLNLGDIEGIPRVLDAGQCNDSYSLVVIAKKLAEAFGVKDINKLPISYNIAWYEQKAVLVLLTLLSLGVKNIYLGPSLPKFISPNVLNVLVEKFDIHPNGDIETDLKEMMGS